MSRQMQLGIGERLGRASVVLGISAAGVTAACGSDDGNAETGDAGGGALSLTLAELCDTLVSGYEEDPSCGGQPRAIARSTCVAASDVVNDATPEIACSEPWRATLECAVRHGEYACDPVSRDVSLPGALACEAQWRQYARCVGRLSGGLVFDFPWHPCEAGDPVVRDGCPFVLVWAQSQHCFESEQSACDCACEHEGGVCSVSGAFPVCTE